MTEHKSGIQLLAWDSHHFGFNVAKAFLEKPMDVDNAVQWCIAHEVCLLIARCDVADVAIIHQMERQGFLLMDTFVRYHFKLAKRQIPTDKGRVPIRPFRLEDIPTIGQVAASAFRGYISHFHNDPLLDRERCDQLYVEWAMNSCREQRLADEVLVADLDGRVVGFATMKILLKDTAEGILFGVDASAQGQGIYRSFMINGMEWCKRQGISVMEVDSQVNHYAVQRVWQRLGFEIYTSGHTFHRWFEQNKTER